MIKPEEPFLRDFFRLLNERNIQYVVMRNADSLPVSLGGSDLDLFVIDEPEGMRAVSAARECAAKYHGVCTAFYQSDEIVSCWGGQHEDETWWGLHIDIVTGVKHRGYTYVDAEFMCRDRVLDSKGFYRSGGLSDVVSFLKEICCNFKSKKNYYELARNAYAARTDFICQAVERCCGTGVWRLVEGLLCTERTEDEVRDIARKLNRIFTWRSLRRLDLQNPLRKLHRLMCPPSVAVAVLGTDGSGKSTVIGAVTPFFERMLHSKVHYEHLRPNLLPSLARLAGRKKMEGPVTNPHGGKVAGRLSSLVRFFYYYIDYTLGYWFKIWPIMVKRPTLVIFDRYYYEYMIDPRRCAVRLPCGWARFFSWFIPKPSLILCLGGDPRAIYARKPETSLDEVTRQMAELKAFCSAEKRAVWVDTTRTQAESCNAACAAILKGMIQA